LFSSAWPSFSRSPLSFCSISKNPIPFDGKIVRIRGNLYVSPNGMINLNGAECGLRSNAWADVSFRETPGLIEELRQLNAGDNCAKAEVVLTGKLKDRKQSCFSAQFAIIDANLERASSIEKVNIVEEIGIENAHTKD
jgi:hypothetical protein